MNWNKDDQKAMFYEAFKDFIQNVKRKFLMFRYGFK